MAAKSKAPDEPERGSGFRESKRAKKQHGVEVASWTPTSHSVTGEDGKTRVSLYSSPTFKRDADGDWVKLHARVDEVETLRRARKGPKNDVAKVFSDGYSVMAPHGAVPVAFGDGGARGLMQQALPGGVVTWHLDGMKPTAPLIVAESKSETVIEYRNVFDGVDLRYRVLPSSVKEEFVLAGPASAREFTFTVDDPRHLLGKVKSDKASGEVSFSGQAGDGIKMSLAAPMAWSESQDAGKRAAGSENRSEKSPAAIEKADARPGDGSASQSVISTRSGYQVVVGLDTEFAADATFPVVLDPTQTYAWSDDTLRVAWAPAGWECGDDPCPPLADATGGVAYVGDWGTPTAYIEAGIGKLPPWIRITQANLSFDMDPYLNLPGREFPYWGNACHSMYVWGLGSPLEAGDGWSDSGGADEAYELDLYSHWNWEERGISVEGNRLSLNVMDTVSRVQSQKNGESVAFAVSALPSCSRSAPRSSAAFLSQTAERSLSDAVFEFTYEGGVLPPPLPIEQTWGCNCRWVRGVDRVDHQADPVNTAAGALMERAVDASSGSIGVPVLAGRTYNGRDTEEGLLGVVAHDVGDAGAQA